ncbi:SCP-like protein [Ancylostoma ceylanicum]|uniref:SCP-like protein n=1 Tax=Ancylostoma ceylanicum TaxID=53326 RepID=A0A0D6LQS3_9BILA|nr:SCP-like protein [Ancylostoma ceylanicum]
MFLPNIALIFVVAIVLPGCLADSYAKPFNCTGQTINDDVREIALYYHNSLRTRINQDQVEDKNKTKLPKAENMYKMIYSCALEEEAAKLVDGCADTYNKSQAHGINFKYFGPGSNPTQLASPLSQILHTWSEQIVTKDWLPNNKYNNDKDLFEFSNRCGQRPSPICDWDPLYEGRRVQDIHAINVRSQRFALCEGRRNASTPIVVRNNNIGISCNDTIVVNTNDIGISCNDTIVVNTNNIGISGNEFTIRRNDCSANKFNDSCTKFYHYYTSNNYECSQRSLSELALGRVSKRNGNMMPKSSNMIKLKYNCDLELKARDHSRKCILAQSDPATRPNTEENIYMVAKTDVPNRVAAIELGVKAWWKRVRKDQPIGPALIFRDHHQTQQIRKFTKVEETLLDNRFIPPEHHVAVVLLTLNAVTKKGFVFCPDSPVFSHILYGLFIPA